MTETAPVVLITGASSGIGAATARLFSKEGYRVVLAARRLERLETLANEIRAQGGEALPVATDMSRLDDINNLAQRCVDYFGQVDILFNNAGFGRLDWLENLDVEMDIQTQIQVNLTGLILLTQALLPHMIERRTGHIINMSSTAGYIATPTYAVYAASKFAVRGFTDALRREVGIHGVKVSGIYPGGVETAWGEIAGINRSTNIATPPFMMLSPEDVGRAVLKLARRPRRSLVIPGVLRFAIWFDRFAPGLVDWLIERMFVRPERLP